METGTVQAGRLTQPFLRREVENYREVMIEQPFKALFYEFSVEKNEGTGYCSLSYIPNGGGDLLFVKKGKHALMEFVGICTQEKSLLAFSKAVYFGVRLYPGTRVKYQGICLNDMVNEEHFFSGQEEMLASFFEKLEQQETLQEKADLFMRYFQGEAKREETDELVRFLVDEINHSRGTVRIQELADKTHYSERHISRIFRDAVGISPKAFSRIVRFQCVVNAILYHPSGCLSEYLEELGYADQAHFQREFKSYMGITPGNFQRMARM